MIISLTAVASDHHFGFETGFDRDMKWCSITIPKGRYVSYGYETFGLSGVTVESAVSLSTLAAGFTACESYGGTTKGMVGSDPAEVQIHSDRTSFAIYIYDI
jgi:hypothetical protein